MNKNILCILIFVMGIGIFVVGGNKNKNVLSSGIALEPSILMEQAPKKEPPLDSKPEMKIKTYKDALEEGKKLEKDVFVLFSASWCHWCNKMKDETLSNNEIKEAMQKYVVYIADLDEEKSLANKFNVSSVPSYIVIDSENEKIRKQGSGFKGVNEFKRWLNFAKHFSKTSNNL